MTTKTPTPVVTFFPDGEGAIVTKTHDVDAALEAILDMFKRDYGLSDNDALDALEPYLDNPPMRRYGRWVRSGSYDGEPARAFKDADPSGRGVTRACVFFI